jgi:hypothetical protein
MHDTARPKEVIGPGHIGLGPGGPFGILYRQMVKIKPHRLVIRASSHSSSLVSCRVRREIRSWATLNTSIKTANIPN